MYNIRRGHPQCAHNSTKKSKSEEGEMLEPGTRLQEDSDTTCGLPVKSGGGSGADGYLGILIRGKDNFRSPGVSL